MRIDEISADFVVSRLILEKIATQLPDPPFFILIQFLILQFQQRVLHFLSEIKNTLAQVGKRCSPEESEFNIEQSDIIEDDENQKLLVCIIIPMKICYPKKYGFKYMIN
jgi:hypothetical protein